MRPETEQKVRRWREQRWIVDNAVQTLGPDWDQGRSFRILAICGPTVLKDIQFLRTTIRKYDDIPVQFALVASKWEKLAQQQEKLGHRETAREYYFFATIFYCHAQWGIFEDDNDNKVTYNKCKNACYDKVIAYGPHHMERVEIPFEQKTLAAVLHLPSGLAPPYAAVLSIPGMDGTKEEVTLYGEPLLERGIAMLRIDGPGMGESNIRKIRATAGNYEQAGINAVDYLVSRDDIKRDAIGLEAKSMGSYWGFRIASVEPRLKACVLTLTCMEPGMNTIFNMASPSFKLNYMYMSGYNDEKQFDEFARTLTLKGLGGKIPCPLLIQAGEYDELSPIKYTYELFDEVRSPKKLMVYRGETHGITHPCRTNHMADWIADRLEGSPIPSEEEEIEYL